MSGCVLVVDDEPAQRELMRNFLEPHGYVIVEADTGRIAIEELAKQDYDAVLLDLGLPDGRGDFVMQWILSNKPHLKQHVIIVSGDPSSVSRDVLFSRLQVRMLAKPYGMRELLDALDEIRRIPAK
jgi:DNA-binding response OmpR family regulator